ncbi:dTDP-glucose 4,6-dehydratase [Egibacter rhizosphaerae]|uniref:dTDP-glucose 4,6-dehydratase n=1 Tax=Egibacter rhizosphaerae TaxID=1670831 RepID=A0A411YGN1_9ACTN|nr:dTDP-glucose 4,6-dehydratase [Egibacter rhizosphaerae]QBI20301.1 dTDP-glucose 4,6-dehydratase [Egibacter rhizosphaerae]
MRILVTGGCGFIGSHLVRRALAEGAEVTNLDALTYAGNPANLADVADEPGYRFVEGDIRDRELLARLIEGHDAVAHFAAESHVDRSIDGSAEFITTNVEGTHAVLEAARRAEVPRILHVSTDEVYGSVAAPHRSAESDAFAPSSPYAASKAAADLLAQSYRTTYDLPVSITRTSNNFGPYHYPEKMIPLFVTNLLDGEPVPVYGDGSNVRDWLYVLDNVDAQWRVLVDAEPGATYNVGADAATSNLELTHRILAAVGAGEDMIRFVADRPGHDLRYSVDSSALRAATGWAPRRSLDDALVETVDWYRSREDWWRPLKQAGATARRGVT